MENPSVLLLYEAYDSDASTAHRRLTTHTCAGAIRWQAGLLASAVELQSWLGSYEPRGHGVILPFSVSRPPEIHFGSGVLAKVPHLAQPFGKRVLLATGGRTFQESPLRDELLTGFRNQGHTWLEWQVETEPSPQLVDDAVRKFRQEKIDVVVAVGGGSVLDAAKAVAGLLSTGRSVMDYLEGVGPEIPYTGPALPFIAVPTTAGTGSEATKNAVLSVQGMGGFKKSFRQDQLAPRHAVVDPRLLATCPKSLIAANGMDALTQLLESYTSSRANPFTDALAWSGLESVRDGLLDWYAHGAEAAESQARMAYAAMLSGITLAQVGLGSVHGMASPLGAFFPIPHGVVCGTLVACATAKNISALRERAPEHPALTKYARVGRLFSQEQGLSNREAQDTLVNVLEVWTKALNLPRLSAYAVTRGQLINVVTHSRGSSMKTNPILLTDDELLEVLAARL